LDSTGVYPDADWAGMARGTSVELSLYLVGGILASGPAIWKISKQKKACAKNTGLLFAGSPLLIQGELGQGKMAVSFGNPGFVINQGFT
jgi:hypothetical protein